MKLKLKKMKGVKEIMLCAGVLLLVFLLSKYVFKGTILEGMEAKGTDSVSSSQRNVRSSSAGKGSP